MRSWRGTVVTILVLVGWTLAIKYALPLGAAWREGRPATTYVMWDAWPLAHLALAWTLSRPSAVTWPFALVVSAAEIAVISAKFARFLAAPVWDFWKTHWFANKVAVLAFFVVLGGRLVLTPAGRELRRIR